VEFVCSVWILEQTANFTLQNIKKIGFYNQGGECLLRSTEWVLI